MGPQFATGHLEAIFVGLFQVVLIAMLVERALSLVFEADPIENVLKRRFSGYAMKEVIALGVSWLAVSQSQLDMLAVIRMAAPNDGFWSVGYFLTAAVVAGGSKGAMILFQDVLGFSKENRTLLAARRAASSAPMAPTAGDAPTTPWWRNRNAGN